MFVPTLSVNNMRFNRGKKSTWLCCNRSDTASSNAFRDFKRETKEIIFSAFRNFTHLMLRCRQRWHTGLSQVKTIKMIMCLEHVCMRKNWELGLFCVKMEKIGWKSFLWVYKSHMEEHREVLVRLYLKVQWYHRRELTQAGMCESLWIQGWFLYREGGYIFLQVVQGGRIAILGDNKILQFLSLILMGFSTYWKFARNTMQQRVKNLGASWSM